MMREQRDDGTWFGKPKLSCETEPDIGDDNYDEWMDEHYSMPYVDWLPIEDKVERWLKNKYDFDMEAKE